MQQVGRKEKISKLAINQAAQFFGIGKVLSAVLIKQGNINSNYILVSEKGKYVLRVYKFKTKKEILSELALLRFLFKKGYPCPEPIGNVFVFEGKMMCCFRFIEGKTSSHISTKELPKIAVLLAKLHLLTKDYRPKYNREGEGLPVIKRYIKNKKNVILASNFKNSKDFIKYLGDNIKKIKYLKNVPRGSIHADVKPENIIRDKKGDYHVIDFDNFYYDDLVVDISDSLMWNCVKNDHLDLKRAGIYFSAYQSVRKLSQSEKNNLVESFKFYCLKGAFKYAFICLPRLKFAEKWAYHFIRLHKNLSMQQINLSNGT